MLATAEQNWRRRMAELARGAGKPQAPLFAPILFAVASQIESLPIAEFVGDAAKLGKGLSELRRALGINSIDVAVPSAMEAEALGAAVELSNWPPRITAMPARESLDLDDPAAGFADCARLQASLEATQRLAASEASQPVLIAVLTGPAALLRQLAPDARGADLENLYDFAGRALAALARLYAEAGVNVVALEEAAVPDAAVEAWHNALSPIANVARFHKVPPLLYFTGSAPAADAWPSSCIACPSIDVAAAHAGLPHAVAVTADHQRWSALPDGADNTRLVLTLGEVPASVTVADLRDRLAA